MIFRNILCNSFKSSLRASYKICFSTLSHQSSVFLSNISRRDLESITSSEVFAEIFLRIQASGLFLKNQEFKMDTLSIFARFPFRALEKFPLLFLINLLSEIKDITLSKEILEKTKSLLIFHLQKQEFDGFRRILDFFVQNPELLSKFYETSQSESFVTQIIREDYRYYSYALTVEILPFVEIVKILEKNPFFVSQDFLKEGLKLKLNNRRYFSDSLTSDEIRAVLSLDNEYWDLQPFIMKCLEMLNKNREIFESLGLENMIKILISSFTARFELDFNMIHELEELVNNRIKLVKMDSLDLWIKAANYFIYVDNMLSLGEIITKDKIEALIVELQTGKRSISHADTFFFLEKANSFINHDYFTSFNGLINKALDEIQKKKEDKSYKTINTKSHLLLLVMLYSSEYSKEMLPVLESLTLTIDENIHFHPSLIYLMRATERVPREINPEKIISIKSRLHYLLKLVLKKADLQQLIKHNPFDFVELLSLLIQLSASETVSRRENLLEQMIEKNLDPKTVTFNEMAFLSIALRKTPDIHHYFQPFFEKKIKDITGPPPDTEKVIREIDLDLKKIAYLIKSFEHFEPVLRECRLKTDIFSLRYAGRFEVILDALQEALLKKILDPSAKKQFSSNPFLEEEREKQQKKKKEEDEVENEEEIKFKSTIGKKEVQLVYEFARSLVRLNMGYLPIYFMCWKIVENFAEKLSIENLVDWLYLLGNCNRLPKELPKPIEARLEKVLKNKSYSDLEFAIKYAWVVVIKNADEIPRDALELLTQTLKNNQNRFNSISLDCKIRVFQMSLLLETQNLKIFDRFLGLSNENAQRLGDIYRDFLKNSRKTKNEYQFKNEIEKFLKKSDISYEKDVILEFEGLPAVFMDFELKQEQNKGFLFIMDSRIFLGTSNVELIEGWVLRKLLKGIKIKTKFLEYKPYYALERRHEKNSYIKGKLKGLGFKIETLRKPIYE